MKREERKAELGHHHGDGLLTPEGSSEKQNEMHLQMFLG